MATETELNNWILNANHTIERYNSIISDCDKKISRLEKVYKELTAIKESFRSNRKQTKAIFKEKGNWRGEKYTSYCSAGEILDDSYEAYYTKLDAAHDAINTEIAELKARKRELVPLVGGLWGDIARWRATLENIGN